LTRTNQPTRREGHRARKGEGGLLREQILDAAEELLYRLGSIGAVSVRAIANRVGVTPPALYLHFEDKDRLFYAVCRRGFDRFAERLGPVLAAEGSASERLRRLGEEYVRFGLENWQQYPILFGTKEKLTIPEDELADDPGLRILDGLIALVDQAQAEGDIRSDLEAASVAAVLWSGVHGAVSLLIGSLVNPDVVRLPPPEALVPVLLETLLQGLETPAS
jgi:AcrR family transcriptional regulator